MNREKIKALMPFLNSKVTGNRGSWIEGHCPLGPWRHGGKDKHASFAIKASDQKKSICKCLSCGFGGDLRDLTLKIQEFQRRSPEIGYNLGGAMQLIANEFAELDFDMSSIPDYEEPVAKAEVVFPESWLASFHLLEKFPEAMAYVRSRGLTVQMARDLELRYDPIQKRVGFPFRDFKGRLMGMQGRSLDPNEELRYFQYGYQNHRNMHCWMGENKLDLDRPVVVTEGPFDAAKIMKHYPNVAASFTTGLSVDKIKRLSDSTELVTFYDYGNGGNAARSRIREVLKGMPIVDIIPSEEDDDAGNMLDSRIREELGRYVNLLPVKP